MKTLSIQRPRPSIEMADVGFSQGVGKSEAGELRALIGIEEAGLAAAADGFFQRRTQKLASIVFDNRRPGPCAQLPDRNQVREAAPHRDVGHAGAPHMAWLIGGCAETAATAVATAAPVYHCGNKSAVESSALVKVWWA